MITKIKKIFKLIIDFNKKIEVKYMDFILMFSITGLVINYYMHNSQFKTIALFLIFFNILYSVTIYSICDLKVNIQSSLNTININMIILALGFIYRSIIFIYFDVNIIYYLTIKDYIMNVFNLIILISFIAILFLISQVIFKYFIKKIPSSEIMEAFLFLFITICISLISFLFLLKPLNINKFNMELINAYLLSFFYFSLIRISYKIKNKNLKEDFFSCVSNKKIFVLLFIVSFFVNSAFLNLYNIIGYSEERLIKKGAEYKVYENGYIFKLDSTENYDFYISKPTNNLLIFEKDYNIIKTKKSKD